MQLWQEFKEIYMKIIPISKKLNKVIISKSVGQPEYDILNQAKGVMENYLKDKNFTVKFSETVLCDKNLIVEGLSLSKNKANLWAISKEKYCQQPFLRIVYKAIEEISKTMQDSSK